jgi:hypothetical protein
MRIEAYTSLVPLRVSQKLEVRSQKLDCLPCLPCLPTPQLPTPHTLLPCCLLSVACFLVCSAILYENNLRLKIPNSLKQLDIEWYFLELFE